MSDEITSSTPIKIGSIVTLGNKAIRYGEDQTTGYLTASGLVSENGQFSMLEDAKYFVTTTTTTNPTNATAAWIIKSVDESKRADGENLKYGDLIYLELADNQGGNLNTNYELSNLPAFNMNYGEGFYGVFVTNPGGDRLHLIVSQWMVVGAEEGSGKEGSDVYPDTDIVLVNQYMTSGGELPPSCLATSGKVKESKAIELRADSDSLVFSTPYVKDDVDYVQRWILNLK